MLRIYDVIIELVGELADVVEAIELRDRALGRQMREALGSVALNAAEGYGNTGGHKRERYQTALGSSREVRGCIDVARGLRYIGAVDVGTLDKLGHVTGALVKLVTRSR